MTYSYVILDLPASCPLPLFNDPATGVPRWHRYNGGFRARFTEYELALFVEWAHQEGLTESEAGLERMRELEGRNGDADQD